MINYYEPTTLTNADIAQCEADIDADIALNDAEITQNDNEG